MFSITIRLMKKSARMLIPAGIAILIGTAFIAATFLFSNTMDDSLRTQMTASIAKANHVAQFDTDSADASADGGTAITVSDLNLERIAATHGVNGARADLTAPLTVSHNDKHISGIAINTAADRKLIPLTISRGDQPADNDEIALPWSLAKQVGATIGDTVTVTSEPTMREDGSTVSVKVRVVGLTEDPNGLFSYYGGGSVLSGNVLAAMSGVEEFGQIHAGTLLLDINETGGAAQTSKTLSQVRALLPDGYRIDTSKAYGDKILASMGGDQSTSVTTTFLLSFGVLAMVVAALVIANTFQVLVAQRRRTLALLRTIGAKKGQLYASVLLEAGLLGAVASALGVGLGHGLMALLTDGGVVHMLGMNVRFVGSWQAIAVPIAFGILMTVLASLGSARSATSVTPLEALRPVELTDTRRAGRIRGVFGTLFIVIGVALAAFAVIQMRMAIGGGDSMIEDGYTTVLLAAIAGAALVFLGLVLTAAFWMPVLMRGVGALVAKCGPSATIAHANIQKNPRRVAATGTALLIGVTLVASIATGAASGKQTMSDSLASRYSIDMIATGDSVNAKTAAKAAQVKGVSGTLLVPTVAATTTSPHGDDMTVLLVGVKNTAELSRVMHVDLNGVSLTKGNALMQLYRTGDGAKLDYGNRTLSFKSMSGTDTPSAPGDSSTTDDPQPGGTIRNGFSLTPTSVDFRRVSDSYDAVAFIDATHFSNGDITASGNMLLASVDAAKARTTLSAVFDALQGVFSSDPSAQVTGPVVKRVQWEQIINNMMLLLVGLIAVAVLIALIGVANTLSLSVIERTRESATLRAIGMTRGQLRRSLAIEALMLSLVAGVTGVILGTLFGWLGSYMVFSLYGTVALPFEWGVNGIVLAVAAVAALLASIAPARRAVRTPPVEALAEA
ncbi:ABC transporter permease [Bifidobacterium leontopitheci]|uniref:ABC transporter permease n=1 Tax=Bifidobacterium leontopitheci TaxID=2650774 RepID=A0A6I1GEN5_9BIFI|nr:FtsX-like permease family protein [Bifidobacterium leontopitheci]KAB7790100.1 ABC transporter permease [Bifidobacterium leontopitheci]